MKNSPRFSAWSAWYCLVVLTWLLLFLDVTKLWDLPWWIYWPLVAATNIGAVFLVVQAARRPRRPRNEPCECAGPGRCDGTCHLV